MPFSSGVKGVQRLHSHPYGNAALERDELEPVAFQQEAEAGGVSGLPLLSPPCTLTKSQEMQARPPISR